VSGAVLVNTAGRTDLGPRLASRLGLGRHCSLQLHGQAHVFAAEKRPAVSPLEQPPPRTLPTPVALREVWRRGAEGSAVHFGEAIREGVKNALNKVTIRGLFILEHNIFRIVLKKN